MSPAIRRRQSPQRAETTNAEPQPGPSPGWCKCASSTTRNDTSSITNNVSERSPRAQAIGRKNYMFVGSDRGGRTAATLYSFVASCKRHQVDPFAYLKDVLERLSTHPTKALGEVLPDAWLEAHPGARRRAASYEVKSTRWLESSNAVILVCKLSLRFSRRSAHDADKRTSGAVSCRCEWFLTFYPSN